MIPRYSPPDMANLFTDAARFALWLEVELLATEAQALLGVVPKEDAAICRAKAPTVDEVFVADVLAREEITNHDVAAFVDVVQERIGAPAGSYIHFGLTSSDVVDTALSATLTRAADLLLADLDRFVATLRARALELMDVPVTGRTHGMHAEPTTFGAKFALWALQADRDRRRMRQARDGIAVGKLSGAVGTFSNIDPEVETSVCAALGLEPVPATQVIARDRHAEFLWACASVGATIELMCTEIRHLARSELGEAEEPFGAGQKGSSAMPHKRNPILSERLCGLARLLRGYLGAGLEDVALWHERDISHSSVERVALPDASLLACYVLRKATGLAAGLVIHADRALDNLINGSFGLVFSQSVLLALVAGGLTRDEAYRIVQRDARHRVGGAPALPRRAGGGSRRHPRRGRARRGLRPHPHLAPRRPLRRRSGGPGMSIELPKVLSGKVRELYDAGEDRLLMVASDRVSAFDVIMAEPIANKGRVLTAMTAFWSGEMSDIVPATLLAADPDDIEADLGDARFPPEWAGRAVLVKRADMLPLECIVRGYLAGQAHQEYEKSGTVHGTAMPPGLKLADRLAEPIFTPSTKAEEGHDINIDFAEAVNLVGAEAATAARDISLELYTRAAARAADVGFILADTKFELGYVDGVLSLCDEVCTPDSSRLWPADQVIPGHTPPAFDKQPLRDWLDAQGWDRTPPPPALPERVRGALSTRYVAAYERVTGLSLDDWYGATS